MTSLMISYLRNMVMAHDLGSTAAGDLRQIDVGVAVCTLHFLLGSVSLLKYNSNIRLELLDLLSSTQLSLYHVLHLVLQPSRCHCAGVPQRCGDDELVMRKDGVLLVFLVAFGTLYTKLAPI